MPPALGLVGCILGGCALILSMQGSQQATPILVYDNAEIAKQAEVFIAAGHDPLTVIDEAVARAVAAGAIVIDGAGVKSPESSKFNLQMFVDLGSEVGKLDPIRGGAADFAPDDVVPMTAETVSEQYSTQASAPYRADHQNIQKDN